MKKQNTYQNRAILILPIILLVTVFCLAGLIVLIETGNEREISSLEEQINGSIANFTTQLYDAAVKCQPITIRNTPGDVVLLDIRCWELLQRQQEAVDG
jgi:peptidoglycan/LPS O-acetylase OafA/YrhL